MLKISFTNAEVSDHGSGRAMTTKMKEKLELYLISQPEVQCINNYLGEIHQRGGIDHE